jgi:peptide/nickel transport system substrate-binding protein
MTNPATVSRRRVLQLLAGGSLAPLLHGGRAHAQGRRGALVIGLDFSDTLTLDPARFATNSAPMVLHAAYDTLLTMAPGNYLDLKPVLATRWARTPDGKGWRFTLRQGVKFASGAPLTADDVKWSLERVVGLKDQPSQYLNAVDRIEVVDPATIDFVLTRPDEPLLPILSAPEFVVLERKVVEANGGASGPAAKDRDKATTWLNQNSAGSGAYRLTGWERDTHIQLVANPNSWRGPPAYERIVIRQISDGAAQLLAVRQGAVDAAFNLLPEQIASAKGSRDVRIEEAASLDFVYLGLTQNAEFNKALAVKEVRQAVGCAIDFDGIRNNLLGGAANRAAHFLPVGVRGSTNEIAREIGFHEDLARARALLAKAGYASGFEMQLAYGNTSFAGMPYQALAQKVQSDLARVGIRATLRPMDPVNFRTMLTGAKAEGGVLGPWIPPAVENSLWAAATVERVAKRLHWTPPADIVKTVQSAATAQDPAQQTQLWIDYQKAMVDQAHLIVLFQPVYRVAVYKSVGAFPLTGAGWTLDLESVKPA